MLNSTNRAKSQHEILYIIGYTKMKKSNRIRGWSFGSRVYLDPISRPSCIALRLIDCGIYSDTQNEENEDTNVYHCRLVSLAHGGRWVGRSGPAEQDECVSRMQVAGHRHCLIIDILSQYTTFIPIFSTMCRCMIGPRCRCRCSPEPKRISEQNYIVLKCGLFTI
jgi:hypothetical protein